MGWFIMKKRILEYLSKHSKSIAVIIAILTIILIVTTVISFIEDNVLVEVVKTISIAITITITISLTISINYTVNNIEEAKTIITGVYYEAPQNKDEEKRSVIKNINSIKQKFQIFIDEFSNDQFGRSMDASIMGKQRRANEKAYLVSETKDLINEIESTLLTINEKDFKNKANHILKDITIAHDKFHDLFKNNSFNHMRSFNPLNEVIGYLEGANNKINDNIKDLTELL
jgi:hypothetical protein